MPYLFFGKSGRRTNRLCSLERALARCHPVRIDRRSAILAPLFGSAAPGQRGARPSPGGEITSPSPIHAKIPRYLADLQDGLLEGWTLVSWPTPEYLLRSGPYRLSRNPMYVGEAVVWLGWEIFYSRAAVCAAGTTIVRWEEGRLLKRFGDEYRGLPGGNAALGGPYCTLGATP